MKTRGACFRALVAVVWTLSAGCTADGAQDGSSTEGSGVPPLSVTHVSGGVVDQALRHLDTLASIDATRFKVVVLPEHESIMLGLIAQLSAEMADQQVPAASAAWSNAADSVRADLGRIREASVPELVTLLPAHRDRALRLIAIHRTVVDERAR